MKEFDKINMIYGAVAAVGVAIFGKYWFLFAGFLILNIVDYVTGYCKARFYNKNESSAIGAKGIFKKVWYWIVIGIAFFIATCFTYMGDIIGVDLGFVLLFGWFTLATYLVNEIRCILENLVEMNVNVPQFLIAGLEITQKLIDNQIEIKKEEENRNE